MGWWRMTVSLSLAGITHSRRGSLDICRRVERAIAMDERP